MANSPIFVTQPGIGYGPINSLTSLTVGTGTQTLTVPSNLAYTAGAWVTIFNTGGAWMYGMVTNYVTTVLSVNVTLTSGSGTFSAWSVNLSGAPAPVFGSVDQYFTATSGQTTFTPTTAPVATCFVYVNSLKQRPGSAFDYQISGGNVVFNVGLMAGDVVEVTQ